MNKDIAKCKKCKKSVALPPDYRVCPECGHIFDNESAEKGRKQMCEILFKTSPEYRGKDQTKCIIDDIMYMIVLLVTAYTLGIINSIIFWDTAAGEKVFCGIFFAIAGYLIIRHIKENHVKFNRPSKAYFDLLHDHYKIFLDLCIDFSKAEPIERLFFVGYKYIFFFNGSIAPLSIINNVSVISEATCVTETRSATAYDTMYETRTNSYTGGEYTVEKHYNPHDEYYTNTQTIGHDNYCIYFADGNTISLHSMDSYNTLMRHLSGYDGTRFDGSARTRSTMDKYDYDKGRYMNGSW